MNLSSLDWEWYSHMRQHTSIKYPDMWNTREMLEKVNKLFQPSAPHSNFTESLEASWHNDYSSLLEAILFMNAGRKRILQPVRMESGGWVRKTVKKIALGLFCFLMEIWLWCFCLIVCAVYVLCGWFSTYAAHPQTSKDNKKIAFICSPSVRGRQKGETLLTKWTGEIWLILWVKLKNMFLFWLQTIQREADF